MTPASHEQLTYKIENLAADLTCAKVICEMIDMDAPNGCPCGEASLQDVKLAIEHLLFRVARGLEGVNKQASVSLGLGEMG